MTSADLAVTLRSLRTRLGITQERAAAATGICRPGRQRHRAREQVSAAELAAFAALYRTTADRLLAGGGEEPGAREAAPDGMVTVPRTDLEMVLAGFWPQTDGETGALKRLLDIVEPS